MKVYYEHLLNRIRQSPYEHLGRCSVSEIRPYFLGYGLAREFWGLSDISYRLKPEEFKEWLDGKVHLCRQDLQTFCLFLGENEKEAFGLFFEFYDSALAECGIEINLREKPDIQDFDQSEHEKAGTLIKFVLDENFRRRPVLYFGNHRQVSGLWALCNGFLWAETDLGIIDSSDAINMELFQLWIEERYPMAKGKPWDKIFYFNTLHSESSAMKQFYEHFEMFLKGKRSDAPPRWVENAVESIKKRKKNESH